MALVLRIPSPTREVCATKWAAINPSQRHVAEGGGPFRLNAARIFLLIISLPLFLVKARIFHLYPTPLGTNARDHDYVRRAPNLKLSRAARRDMFNAHEMSRILLNTTCLELHAYT